MSEDPVRVTAWAVGRVQGVGLRWWIRDQALELGLTGSATNLDDGRVEVVAEGPRSACERLLDRLGEPDAPGRVESVPRRWSAARDDSRGFLEC